MKRLGGRTMEPVSSVFYLPRVPESVLVIKREFPAEREKMNTSYLMIPDSGAPTAGGSGVFVSVLHVAALCGSLHLRYLWLQTPSGDHGRAPPTLMAPRGSPHAPRPSTPQQPVAARRTAVKSADRDPGHMMRSSSELSHSVYQISFSVSVSVCGVSISRANTGRNPGG